MDASEPLDLIARARQLAGADDPLDLLDAAVAVAAEAGTTADAAVEHFVHAAREAGLSWTAIGARLGVSKQAARQRFGDSLAATPDGAVSARLQACLDAARAAAVSDGSAVLGTQHLLLGLLKVGVAANALDRLGVTRERVLDAGRMLFTSPPAGVTAPDRAGDRDARPTDDPDVRAALARARRLSRERGCGEVATEHLLFVLATDPGSAARRVLNALDVALPDLQRELEGFLPPVGRARLGRRRRATAKSWPSSSSAARWACSFCGGSPEGRGPRLIAGPGVYICAECVQLCTEILAEDAADAGARW
ncbi:MAG: Clp protease N-terminal domain-containing protein [Kineosporiaceae bacterium]|jgi:ATP-dependent Clp protease ATP-binding subunit ClpA